MSKQILIVLGILLVFGCADVSKENQLQTGCSEGSESTPENVYVAPAPNPAPTVICTGTFGSSWPQQFGSCSSDGSEDHNAPDVTIGSDGSVYVTSNTWGSLDGSTNSNADNSDVYLVKFTSSGTKEWIRQWGSSGTENDWGHAVSIDSSNNIFVAATVNYGTARLFKYDQSGNKLWEATPNGNYAFGVTTDSSGNSYVVGKKGRYDAWIGAYNSTGNQQWYKEITSSKCQVNPAWEGSDDVAVDSSGNVFVVGNTYGCIDGNSNSGKYDIFLIKYDTNGNQQWVKQFGTSSTDISRDVDIDSNGNVYIVGYSSGDLAGTNSSTNHPYEDIILVKYSNTGNEVWKKQFGASSNDQGTDIAIDNNDNVYITGWTHGGLDNQTYAGGRDYFVSKYDTSGNKQWTRQSNDSSDDSGLGIAVDASGNVFVSGRTRGSMDGNANRGNYDSFVVKYDSNGNKQ